MIENSEYSFSVQLQLQKPRVYLMDPSSIAGVEILLLVVEIPARICTNCP